MAECSSVVTSREVKLLFDNLCREFIDESGKILEEELNKKKEWTRKWLLKRDSQGASSQLMKELRMEDPLEYKACLRMSPESFDELLQLVEGKISKQDTLMRKALSPKLKLEVTLSFLATGNSYRSLQHLFRVSKPAISDFIPKVCEALCTSLQEYMQVPQSEDEWNKIELGFRDRWNFTGCYGAIDGKHVHIRAPENCGSTFFNYKKRNSIILFALVDHDYRFTFIDVGSNGSMSDSTVFQRSPLFNALEAGMLPAGGVIVGDDAFALKEYLMKPYSGQLLDFEQKIFNYRLSRARRIVENAFGILVSRFRIFEKAIPLLPETVDKVICAACSLHNFLRSKSTSTYMPRDTVDSEDFDLGSIIKGSWRMETKGLQNVKRVGPHQQSNKAKGKRDAFKTYFANEGAVEWQNKMIH